MTKRLFLILFYNIVVLLVWGCEVYAAVTVDASKLLDPLYIAGTIIVISFGGLSLSVGRNIKSLDNTIAEVKAENVDLREKIEALAIKVAEVVRVHDFICGDGRQHP